MIFGDHYGILNRLILNEPIEPSPEGVLRLLGFVHLYTASGLHLLALEAVVDRFSTQSLLLRRIVKVLFWIFLLLIWKTQGFRLGFARILILFFLRALARAQGFRWRVYYPLFLALCFDFALGISSGWQHYYLAILGGMLGLEFAQKRHENTIFQHFYLSLGSWLMTAPLDLFLHHEIAWMTPLWSMLTIPVIASFLYPASVLSYFCFGHIPSLLVECWNQGIGLCLWIVDQGFTVSYADGRCVWIALIFAIGVSLYFRWQWIVLAVVVLVGIRGYGIDDSLRLIQFNVGQGDSLLVQKLNRVEMIDLGSARESKPESWMHRLMFYGVAKVDTVLFSHLDEDHAGGIKLLLPWVSVSSLEMSPRLERAQLLRSWVDSRFQKIEVCSRDCFQLGSVDQISSRSSSVSHRASRLFQGNDLMATAIIPLSEHEVYLALGDSSSEQEHVFMMRNALKISSFHRRILKISHHGSHYSSSADFLEQIHPSLAVISVGKHNRYHHPHVSVIQRLNGALPMSSRLAESENHSTVSFSNRDRIPIHRTDRDGDFVWP